MKDRVNINLSAIDQYIETNIPVYKEKEVRNKDYVTYGEDNKYPEYLWDLYNNVATLQSIINGTVDFICGNEVTCNVEQFKNKINKNGDTMLDLVKRLALDKLIFGGFAIQVIRNNIGEISELYPLDLMKLRSDKKNEIFYYSDKWGTWGSKAIIYPKFKYDDLNASSIYYNKGNAIRTVYPTPTYGAAIIACELEKSINEFHLNSINNGFTSNAIINFNNGQPNEEQKEEIERLVNEKFGGYKNAGRILISYNDSETNKATVERIDSDNFDEKYTSLAKRSKEQIFTSFRCNANLFGIPNENAGFNTQEYAESFKLYNRTVVMPLQKEIIDSIDKILNTRSSVTIKPFSLDYDKETIVD